MPRQRALVIGLTCGTVAALLQAWLLLRWLGFGLWFLVLVVPLSLLTMQAVGGAVAKALLGSERG